MVNLIPTTDRQPPPRLRARPHGVRLAFLIILVCLTSTAGGSLAASTLGASPASSSRDALVHAAFAPGFQFGLADYEPASFSDPRVSELGVRVARDVVPWNVALERGQLATMTAWLSAVRNARIIPLITFQHAQSHGGTPSPARFLAAFEKFRKLFPWVDQFCPWDEATHAGQPTQHKPRLAAEYYNEMVKHCSGCVITAPDTLDADGNVEGWIHTFLRTARPYPKVWPFNPYVSISVDTPTRIERFLRAIRGQVWFSEAGGVVWWRFKGKLIYHGEAYAANVARNLFKLARLSPRITRIYYYHWRSPGNPHKLPHRYTWDSGLIRSDGTARPALYVVASELHLHVQPNTPGVF